MQQMFLCVHKMDNGAIRIKVRNNELYQIARAHLGFRRISQLTESIITVFFIEAGVFIVVLNKARLWFRLWPIVIILRLTAIGTRAYNSEKRDP